MRKYISTSVIILCCLFILSSAVYSDEYGKSSSILASDYAEYMQNIRQKIQKNWEAPDFVEEGHATVIFKVDKNGEILSSEITASSGNEVYDNSTLEALNKSAPFGSFPSGTTRNSLTIQYNFDTSLVKTDVLKDYALKAKQLYNVDNKKALEYINLAIAEAGDNCAAFFLYARRARIYEALGHKELADKDLKKSKELKLLYNKKKIESCKKIADKEGTAYSYFILANAYDSAGEYTKAIETIDIAIKSTMLNNGYKRYRDEIIARQKQIK